MTGLKRARLIWTVAFLGVTLAAIVMEVVAGVFHPAGSIPWTEYLAQYVPWPVQLVAYVVLAVWLPFHFWRHDHMRKTAYRQGFVANLPNLGLATTRVLLEELKARGEVEQIAWGGTSPVLLHNHAALLLRDLSPATLAYRTVDGG